MSDHRRISGSSGGTFFRRGSYNCFCQRCGKKVKAEHIREEWDRLRVCTTCYEERHSQDLVRAVPDMQAVPFAVPEPADTFVMVAATQGLTSAAFHAGPDYDAFDRINTLSVRIFGDPLHSSTTAGVLAGANMCAVQNPTGGWEILQYTTATATAPLVYSLSGLLRARVGTENAMLPVLAAGAPFVFIGQSGVATYDWIRTYLGIGNQPFSPCDVRAFNDGSDIVYGWSRRTKAIRLDQDDWDDILIAPLAETEERYEIDILSSAGAKLRTLHAVGTTQAVYPYAAQTADFGGAPGTYSIRVYQVSPDYGRGSYRTVTFP
jgi:hypothetical protein